MHVPAGESCPRAQHYSTHCLGLKFARAAGKQRVSSPACRIKVDGLPE